MKKIIQAALFFTGWLLSPFTWWNDIFVNIPISYLLANILFYTTHLAFIKLVIGSYWLTNIVGILLMYIGGKDLFLSSRHKVRTIVSLTVFLLIYSAVMLYLDRRGTLQPIGVFLERYNALKITLP